MVTVTQLAKYNQGERAVLKLWKPGYLAAKTTSECKTAFAIAAAELFNYWITQMKTDAEKKKGFSPEEQKQRKGVNVMVIVNQMEITGGPKDIAKRMDTYKEHIEEYANQYLEAAVLGELEKAKSAYTEGCLLTENIGKMVQEEVPDWVDVDARIQTAATKQNSLGYRSMAMQQIYFAMEPLEHDAVKEEIAKLQVERNSEPVQQQYAMLGALKALDANCHDMFKRFGMLTYSIAMFLDPEGNPKFTRNVPVHLKIVKQTLRLFLNAHYLLSQHCEEVVMANYLPTALMFKFRQPHNMVAELANKWYNILLAKQEIEQPFKFRVYYNTKEKQMMPARYSADQLSVHVASEASDMLPNVPPPERARLSRNTSRHVIISDNGTHSGSPALSILMQNESPLPAPVSPLRKIKKGGKTKLGKKRLKGARANLIPARDLEAKGWSANCAPMTVNVVAESKGMWALVMATMRDVVLVEGCGEVKLWEVVGACQGVGKEAMRVVWGQALRQWGRWV
ncbi:hypothetical protein BDN71DRAFT_1435659 [Pleurotus eryngii]|uniref:Uncharacterized protein n=1 Tax=Pleurotus eryngii TaxID=5323 RepID=A0A9P5ZJ96_PLEER|nr:hypothetical protein BDN71DRAFT_1435659 [Pleurotus eryngii]